MPTNWEDNKDIQILREYLRIPSVHSDNEQINYGKQKNSTYTSISVITFYKYKYLHWHQLLNRFWVEMCF